MYKDLQKSREVSSDRLLVCGSDTGNENGWQDSMNMLWSQTNAEVKGKEVEWGSIYIKKTAWNDKNPAHSLIVT